MICGAVGQLNWTLAVGCDNAPPIHRLRLVRPFLEFRMNRLILLIGLFSFLPAGCAYSSRTCPAEQSAKSSSVFDENSAAGAPEEPSSQKSSKRKWMCIAGLIALLTVVGLLGVVSLIFDSLSKMP